MRTHHSHDPTKLLGDMLEIGFMYSSGFAGLGMMVGGKAEVAKLEGRMRGEEARPLLGPPCVLSALHFEIGGNGPGMRAFLSFHAR